MLLADICSKEASCRWRTVDQEEASSTPAIPRRPSKIGMEMQDTS